MKVVTVKEGSSSRFLYPSFFNNCSILYNRIRNEGDMMTMDFCDDRIRVFMDETGKVTRQPKQG